MICPILKRKKKKKISDFHYFCISKWPSIIKLRTLATNLQTLSTATLNRYAAAAHHQIGLNHIFIILKYTHA